MRSLIAILKRLLGWLLAGVGHALRLILLAWAGGAIYFSNLPWAWMRALVAIGFVSLGIWAFWLTHGRRPFRIFAGLYLALIIWWCLIPPSHDRPWRREVAVMPRAFVDGDRVRITGYRNFHYRATLDFDDRYEEREIDLSHVTGVDFYISYFMRGPVAHTFLSFCFDNAPPLCISIETRTEMGEGFDPLASLFKQFELIYIVGSEQDIVGVRTKHRAEDVYLYRLRTSPAKARELLRVYLQRINELADHPEWYHLLSNSCTINIVRYANLAGRQGPLDYRHILNGWIDRYFYDRGYFASNLPFAELRRRSRINEAANKAIDDPDFPQRIREGLPATRP